MPTKSELQNIQIQPVSKEEYVVYSTSRVYRHSYLCKISQDGIHWNVYSTGVILFCNEKLEKCFEWISDHIANQEKERL